MADKEATIYIVDVGFTMGQKHSGRDQTDLDWAMEWVWDRITHTVSFNHKTKSIGFVGLRTDGTSHDLADDDGYKHISVLHEIGQMLMPDIRKLSQKIKPSHTKNGDAISSLIVAIEMMKKFTRELKFTRRICLVTNADGYIDPDDIADVSQQILDRGIMLTVLGIDFDDKDFGFKEEGKSERKAENEKLLADLVERSQGVYGTMQQAISELEVPRIKPVRSMPTFRGTLTLGNPDASDAESVVRIQVHRYAKTKIAKPQAASKFIHAIPSTQPESVASSATVEAGGALYEDALLPVRSNRFYEVPDETAPGGKRQVDQDKLEKGFEYGRTAVHISTSDENITKLETAPGLEIMGFVPQDNFERYLAMSDANMIVASDPKSNLALSSLIHALYEMETYAIARLVTKGKSGPIIVVLAPSLEPDFECLIEVQVPFAEDVRPYRFPPLDRVVTVSGKEIYEHNYLPKDDLMAAMSEYVDHMDLSSYDRDDEGNPTEYMAMEDTYSPILHRLDQAVRRRAMYPQEEVQAAAEILTKYSQIPQALQEETKPYLDKLVKAADVKPVPPKAQGRKRNRASEKPMSGLDVDALLRGEKRQKLTPSNAIPEFKQFLSTSDSLAQMHDAVQQLGSIVETRIRDSMGDANYERAVEEIGAMRSEMIDYEEPGFFNEFVRTLKGKLLAGKLGGDRREMWYLIRMRRLGLIDKKICFSSEVEEDEARDFLSAR